MEIYQKKKIILTLLIALIVLNANSQDVITKKDGTDINVKVKEITIEANPGESPKHRLKAYRELGVNRISLGFQSLNDNLLRFLDRLHQSEDCLIAYNDARSVGFDNINIRELTFNADDLSAISGSASESSGCEY